MTKREPGHAPRPRHVRHSGARTRLMAGAAVALCAAAAFVFLFDRQDLPAPVRNNPYVAEVYKERDAAITKSETLIRAHLGEAPPPDANAEMKQQGYPKDDRAKLETIITKGTKTE